MINTVIFDMDGTVLNTLDDITNSVNVSLEFHHLPLKSSDEVKLAVGSGALNLIKRIVPEDSTEELIQSVYKVYQDYYDQHSNVFTAPYPHIKDVLKELKLKGYKLAVVSNKHEYLVKDLNVDVFDSIFDISIGQTDGIPIKPAPDMLYRGLDLLGSKLADAIFIGDSDVDMQTAYRAKMKSIGVTWGFRERKTLEEEHATYIIDSPQEIIPIIERI